MEINELVRKAEMDDSNEAETKKVDETAHTRFLKGVSLP
jgi:hypothetical protein